MPSVHRKVSCSWLLSANNSLPNCPCDAQSSSAVHFKLESANQKQKYDESLMKKTFADIKSVLFFSKQEPSVVFSGVFYPEFDFMGRQLQDLGDLNSKLDMMAFCSVPMVNSWAFLFAWHSDSSEACVDFMASLATVCHQDGRFGDHLFRLVVSNCENMAMRPRWLESLSEKQRNDLAQAITHQADISSPTSHDYLMHGLDGISNWQFDGVISNMDKLPSPPTP
jgi:hypothetical protein